MAKKDPSPRAKAFKRWMEARGLTTKRVAREAEIPYTTLASFAQGDTQTLGGDKETAIATTYRSSTAEIFEGAAPTHGYVPVIGRAGADPSGRVLFAHGDAPRDRVPLPPGGTNQAVALKVVGHSMRGFADDGSIIYFEDQRTPPGPEMLRQVVVAETDSDEVVVKRLLRGSEPGRYDLESLDGPVMHDVRLTWAALITAIVPPYVAARIIVSEDEAA